MSEIVQQNPFRCRMWALHDRLSDHVTEETCRAEIDSFMKHGQLLPVLGRPVSGDPDYDVELICGARRLFVARHLNMPIAAELRQMTDREAIVAMDIENRQRADLSAYERGVGYARWLKAGYFKTQDDIARTLRVSASQVSRLLKLARLPTIIIDAFGGPLEICESWGLDIVDACEDPAKRAGTVRVARAICGIPSRPPAHDVYMQLLSASAEGCKRRTRDHDEVIKDHEGNPLFRIRQQSQAIALLLPRDRVSTRSLDNIRRQVAKILHDENTQRIDSMPKTANRCGELAVERVNLLRRRIAVEPQLGTGGAAGS